MTKRMTALHVAQENLLLPVIVSVIRARLEKSFITLRVWHAHTVNLVQVKFLPVNSARRDFHKQGTGHRTAYHVYVSESSIQCSESIIVRACILILVIFV